MRIVIHQNRHWREISSSGGDNSSRLLSGLTSGLLVRNQDDIGVSNSLNVNSRGILKLGRIKHKHNDIVVPSLSQPALDVTRDGERGLLNKGEFSALCSECLNSGKNIGELRATRASMKSELFKSLGESSEIDINGALASLVNDNPHFIDVSREPLKRPADRLRFSGPTPPRDNDNGRLREHL